MTKKDVNSMNMAPVSISPACLKIDGMARLPMADAPVQFFSVDPPAMIGSPRWSVYLWNPHILVFTNTYGQWRRQKQNPREAAGKTNQAKSQDKNSSMIILWESSCEIGRQKSCKTKYIIYQLKE
jgi:hypothetical protein